MADPQLLADLAKARLPTKLPALRKALTARFREHHGYLLARMLSHVEALEADIAALSERITEMVEPWAGQLMILDSGHRGRDAGSRGHPCRDRPGHESVPHRGAPGVVGGPVPRPARAPPGGGAPRRHARVRPGWPGVLTECAWAAVKTKGTYLSAYYRQIMRRQGKQKATVAVTHKIVVIVWHLLSTGTLYDRPRCWRRAQDQ